MEQLSLADRIERYDPKLSPDNRADELALHQDIVMLTGIGQLVVDFDRTFIRSIDAALTLVPEGCGVIMSDDADGKPMHMAGCFSFAGGEEYAAQAATRALALCAAALRARARDDVKP